MTMHAAFLADIAASAEEGPRLVYADWLDEHGDADRARFIRAQCRLARLGPCDPERFGLEIAAEELLAEHGKKWLKPLAKVGTRVEFARGFPHRIALPVARFVERGEAALAAAPTLREYRPLQHAAAWDGLLKCPALGKLTSLDAGYAKLGAARVAALAACPLLAGLRSLNVSGSAMRRRGLAALIASRHLAGLRRLDLRGNELGDAGVGAFAASPNFPALEALDVSANGLSAAGVAALARSPLAARLKELAVREERGGDAEAVAFAAGRWPSLRKLSLSLGQMTTAGISALAACPSLSGLRELHLAWEGGQTCAALFASPHLEKLERLALLSTAGPGSLEALAGSPMLANLRGLVIERCDRGMDAVLAAPASAGLVELRYAGYGEGVNAAARRFARAGHLRGLRKLSFGPRHSRDTSWVPEFVGSAHLAGVVALELTAIDAAALEAVVASPHLGGLRRLRLSAPPFCPRAEWCQKLDGRFGPGVATLS
jgi:uncharacterized protein (TIGR02996 family)